VRRLSRVNQSLAPKWLAEFVVCVCAGNTNISEHVLIESNQIVAGPPTQPRLVYHYRRLVKYRLSRLMEGETR
jgi:hypothetical protein